MRSILKQTLIFVAMVSSFVAAGGAPADPSDPADPPQKQQQAAPQKQAEPATKKPSSSTTKKPSPPAKKTSPEPALQKKPASEQKPKPVEKGVDAKNPPQQGSAKTGSPKIASPNRAVVAAGATNRPGTTPGFTNRIQPLLGKLGCSGRACHGSFQGQGGFRLSLFGSDPAMDHDALVNGTSLNGASVNGASENSASENTAERPRVDLEKPEASLILMKATARVDHGGSKRFDVDSQPYRMLLDWIAAGASFDPAEIKVERLEVLPGQVVLSGPGQHAALKVVAHYADRTQEDVTLFTQFTTNDGVVAEVTEDGVVTAGDSGDTAIVATFGGSVGTTHVLVPLPAGERRSFTFQAANPIDDLVAAKWKILGYEPSEPAGDAEFLRRVSLDLIGTLPIGEEVTQFLADTDAQKRRKKIEALLERPEYAFYWATQFSDLTGNDSLVTPAPSAKTAWLWYGWLEEKLRKNVPYDELVAGFVTATTREGRSLDETLSEYRRVAADIMPPWSKITERFAADWDGRDGIASPAYAQRKTNDLFWRAYENPEQAALRISYAFLGLRLECAQCHKHPYDRWTQQDFRGFTALFANVRHGAADDVPAGAMFPSGQDERTRDLIYRFEEIYIGAPRSTGQKQKGAVDPNGKLPMTPRVPGGPDVVVAAGEDPRVHLMAWMRHPENGFFAPALVNRLWGHYFGVPLVAPTDELSAANPPSNPALLDWLARDFIEHQFDLKHLHRTILNSRTYQLSWRPTDNNRLEERNYTHARLRRLPAEVLVDALDSVTGGVQEPYAWNAKTFSLGIAPEGTRAIGLAPTRLGRSPGRYPLEIFGRPTRGERCDAERNADVTLSQALYLLYDDDVKRKIGAADGRLARLLENTPDDGRVVEELYLSTVGRRPSADERQKALDYVSRSDRNRKNGFEDLLWSLVNLREFTFNH